MDSDPMPPYMSCTLHSRPDPVVLALGDSFLKARPEKEVRVADLG